MKTEIMLLRSQVSAIGPYAEPLESNLYTYTLRSYKIHFYIYPTIRSFK